MIKAFVARAQVASLLESEQIIRLHGIEISRGYALPPYNICDFFRLPSLRERFGIPEETEPQTRHNRRLEDEIDRLGLKSTAITETELDWIHLFTWNVYNRKGEIVWEYSGSGRTSHIKNLLRS